MSQTRNEKKSKGRLYAPAASEKNPASVEEGKGKGSAFQNTRKKKRGQPLPTVLSGGNTQNDICWGRGKEILLGRGGRGSGFWPVGGKGKSKTCSRAFFEAKPANRRGKIVYCGEKKGLSLRKSQTSPTAHHGEGRTTATVRGGGCPPITKKKKREGKRVHISKKNRPGDDIQKKKKKKKSGPRAKEEGRRSSPKSQEARPSSPRGRWSSRKRPSRIGLLIATQIREGKGDPRLPAAGRDGLSSMSGGAKVITLRDRPREEKYKLL